MLFMLLLRLSYTGTSVIDSECVILSRNISLLLLTNIFSDTDFEYFSFLSNAEGACSDAR